MRSMDLRSLAAVETPHTNGGDRAMFKGTPNGRFLARMLAGLMAAVIVIAGSLGHALYNSQAFF